MKETIFYIKQHSSFSQRFPNGVLWTWFCKDCSRAQNWVFQALTLKVVGMKVTLYCTEISIMKGD